MRVNRTARWTSVECTRAVETVESPKVEMRRRWYVQRCCVSYPIHRSEMDQESEEKIERL